MDWNGTKRGEHERFRQVLAWCAGEVITRLSKTGRFVPRLFFVRMDARAIVGIGTVEVVDDAGDTLRHLESMCQVVDLPNVDVVVLVRHARDVTSRPASNTNSEPAFMFHLIGKRYEATVVYRREGRRKVHDAGADLRLDQLYPRDHRSLTRH